MNKNAGIDNALKMREMFIRSGVRVRFDCINPTLIRVMTQDNSYYFNSDGTYHTQNWRLDFKSKQKPALKLIRKPSDRLINRPEGWWKKVIKKIAN